MPLLLLTLVRVVCFGVCLFWNFNPSKAWNFKPKQTTQTFVIKIQQSKTTVNKSRDHSYFEEFALIKHMNIHSRIKPSSPLYVCDKDSIQLLFSEATPIRGHTPSGPLLPLVRPPSSVGVTPPHWSCVYGGGHAP